MMSHSMSDHYFSQVYLEYRPALNRFLLKLSGNPQDAADLLQETFLKYYQKGSAPESAKSWLFQTGYRLFIDNWRRRKKYLGCSLESIPEPVSDSSALPENLYIRREMKQDLLQVLNELKPNTKAAVLLRIQTDATYQEIAAQIGCPENTVKSAIRRTRFHMNKMMDAEKINNFMSL